MAKVNLDTTETLDITCRQGDTFELTITLKDASGNGLNLVTDNYGFIMQVRQGKSGRSALRSRRVPTSGGGGEADPPEQPGEGITNDPNIVIGSAELGIKGPVNFLFNDKDDNGNVTLFVSAADMRKVRPGRYRYDFQYVAGTTHKTVLKGGFVVNADISKII